MIKKEQYGLNRLVLCWTIGLFSILWLQAFTETATGQSLSVSGTVVTMEEGDPAPVTGTNIQLLTRADSSMVRGTTSDRTGAFELNELEPGDYLLRVSYLGFRPVVRDISLEEENLTELLIQLEEAPLQLNELFITSRRPRVEVQGDTTRFLAGGYQANPDASAEDLVRRMPGFMMQDGRLQAQGEDVQRVLVDGEEFFGDDASLTLRNLPATMISEVEIFDRRSEQSRFTGFDDGSGERTLNVVTKEGMNRGQFGRVGSSFGTDTRYLGTGNYNYFNGSQRVTLLGMSNNINQLNFSRDDLVGLSENQGRGGRGGRSGGNARNFMVGGQSGISTVHSGGLNYNDRWGDSWKINSSYFFNTVDNVTDRELNREYITGVSENQLYDEETYQESENYNHRFNMRLEHTFDERRSFIFTPRFALQRNNSSRTLDGLTVDEENQPINEITSINRTDNGGFDLSGNLLYRHRFEKEGRTFSANVRSAVNDDTGERYQYDESLYFGESSNEILTDRQVELFTGGQNYSADFSWTEPAGENGQVMLTYEPSYSFNESIQDAFRPDEVTGKYNRPDTSLSNRYENRVWNQRGRGSYRHSGEKTNVDLNLSLQQSTLNGEQIFPRRFDTSESWTHLLPGASLRYRINDRANLRLSYNTGTRIPSARQLQDVIDDSDPLRLTTGNPDLAPQYDHRTFLRARAVDAESGRSSMVFVSMGYSQNHIGSRTFIAESDTLVQEGIRLGRGGRLITTDNLGDSWNIRTFLNRSVPFDLIRSNLNLFSGVSYSRTPSVINDEKNWSRTLGLNGGISTSSNISPDIDFRFSYRASYNLVSNTIRPELDNNYYSGRAYVNMDLMPWGGLVVAGNMNFQHFEGLGEEYNRSTLFLNAALGYKFLENQAAEIRISVYDLLARNNSINRTVSDNYIEDMRSNVLSRYALLTFSYNFRSFPAHK